MNVQWNQLLVMVLGLLGTVACSSSETPSDPAPGNARNRSVLDAGPGAGAGDAEGTDGAEDTRVPLAAFGVTLGTGRNTHVPLVDGDTLHLELGHQGLQHVLVSIQLEGLPQDRYIVDFQLVRTDGVAVSEPARVRLPFNAMADGSGSELTGYTLVIADPALGVGHDAVLRVTVEGPEGGTAGDEREVHVEWAPEGWNPDTDAHEGHDH